MLAVHLKSHGGEAGKRPATGEHTVVVNQGHFVIAHEPALWSALGHFGILYAEAYIFMT
jgi:hypothetical protein